MYFKQLSKIYDSPVTLVKDIVILMAVLCCSFGALHWSQSSLVAASPWFVIAVISSICVGMWHVINPDSKMDTSMYLKRIEIMLGVPVMLVFIISMALSIIPSDTSTSGTILNVLQFVFWIYGAVAGCVLSFLSVLFGSLIINILKPKSVEGA